jgi:hypothetical protein
MTESAVFGSLTDIRSTAYRCVNTDMQRIVRTDLPLDRDNLWLLYCVLRFTKSDIEDLTGWARGRIDYGIRKWDLSMFSDTWADTYVRLSKWFAAKLGVPFKYDQSSIVVATADAFLERMRAQVRSGDVDLSDMRTAFAPSLGARQQADGGFAEFGGATS